MAVQTKIWNGNDWQGYCLDLLKLRYGPNGFQEIPDQDRGDCGIEGFAIDGCAFQCYASQEFANKTKMYEDQRDKMTEDLGKLRKNANRIMELLDGIRIKTWILLVPVHASKELNAHASRKAVEIRSADPPLSFVHDLFRVHVATDSYFPVERQTLAGNGCTEVCPLDTDIQTADAVDWANTHTELISNLKAKATKLPTLTTEEKRTAFCNQMLLEYLKGQNALDQLRKSYPNLYEKVVQQKKQRAQELVIECLTPTAKPIMVFRNEISYFKEKLATEVKGLGPYNASIIARESVADWLLECPLDFLEDDNG